MKPLNEIRLDVALAKADAIAKADGEPFHVFQEGSSTWYFWLPGGKKEGPFSSSEKARKYATEASMKDGKWTHETARRRVGGTFGS